MEFNLLSPRMLSSRPCLQGIRDLSAFSVDWKNYMMFEFRFSSTVTPSAPATKSHYDDRSVRLFPHLRSNGVFYVLITSSSSPRFFCICSYWFV